MMSDAPTNEVHKMDATCRLADPFSSMAFIRLSMDMELFDRDWYISQVWLL